MINLWRRSRRKQDWRRKIIKISADFLMRRDRDMIFLDRSAIRIVRFGLAGARGIGHLKF
jgi:hypothetical protein